MGRYAGAAGAAGVTVAAPGPGANPQHHVSTAVGCALAEHLDAVLGDKEG